MTRWKPGDEVVIHCNQSCGECPECNGLDPMACTQQKIWAYESNWGSFAEFCKVQAQQLLPKPPQLSWEDAASYGLTYFTAYRMLVDQAEINAGDNVLVWGAGGGLGIFAVQLCSAATARTRSPSSRRDDKIELVRELGAHGRDRPPRVRVHGSRTPASASSTRSSGSARRCARLTGGADPDVVFEHVGQATFFTSVFVCKTFGTIVICGATSGFNLDFDVRYLWMRQKRIIGSHFANAYECHRANQLIIEGKIKPVLSRMFPFASARSRTR